MKDRKHSYWNNSERTKYSKEFLLDDGTKLIAEYDQPVHYMNGKDSWGVCDNSLVAEKSSSTADESVECKQK